MRVQRADFLSPISAFRLAAAVSFEFKLYSLSEFQVSFGLKQSPISASRLTAAVSFEIKLSSFSESQVSDVSFGFKQSPISLS